MANIICFVGPSGVGKTSYIKRLMNHSDLYKPPLIVTTRKNRLDDGKNYIYVSESDFAAMVIENKFIEHDHYSGYYYGTLESSVSEIINLGGICILDLTPKGCLQTKDKMPDAKIIAFLPDNIDWLYKRLQERGTDNDEEIRRRTKLLKNFVDEVKSLQAETIYCSYSPESWDPTFANLLELLDSISALATK